MRTSTILLVEDNPDDEMLALRAFKKNNITNEVNVARDGVEALDFMFGRGTYEGRDVPHQRSLILLDLKLPKMDGLEVLKALRANEHTKLIPVVVMTTSKEEDDLVRSYSLGANSYIRKPVDFNQFIDAVRQVGLYWLVLNEPLPAHWS